MPKKKTPGRREWFSHRNKYDIEGLVAPRFIRCRSRRRWWQNYTTDLASDTSKEIRVQLLLVALSEIEDVSVRLERKLARVVAANNRLKPTAARLAIISRRAMPIIKTLNQISPLLKAAQKMLANLQVR